jgi:GcrA cell cycle regulator
MTYTGGEEGDAKRLKLFNYRQRQAGKDELSLSQYRAHIERRKASNPWTAARVVLLTGLWNAKKTASYIAEAIGLSRNQVIGKAHRLGLAERASPIMRPLRVIDLKPKHCRFPHGHPGEPGFRFCGKPRAEESSYCPEHERATRIEGSSYENMERLRKRQSRRAA